MYNLIDIVKIEKQIELFSIDEKISQIDNLKNSKDLLLCKTVDRWFENLLIGFKEFDNNRYIDFIKFYNNLQILIKPYNNIYENNYHVINSNIKELEKTRATVEENIINGIKNHNYVSLVKTFESIIEKSSFGYAGKISSMKQRLLDSVNKETCEYFWLCEDETIDNFFIELKKYLADFLQECRLLKSKKTQELLKDRSQVTLTLGNWDTDQDYLDYTEYWKNDFIVDKFLGIAGQYIDWKYPVAYIDPNIGELTRHIISGDPFYVIDDRTMPYENILESLPNESRRKILHYDKKTALSHLEKASIGVCISWNNFPFITQGNIYKEIQLISELLKPGGYAIFNYADAHSVQGAEFVEKNIVPVIWKERIDRYTQEFDLIEIDTNFYAGYPFTVSVYQKIGKTPELSLINKLGLVLPDQKQLNQKRLEQSEESLKIRAARSKLEQDLKRLQERDQLLRELDEKRQLGKENVLELKLQQALNHLSAMITAYDDYTHPSVLESLLHVSKITYSLGRVKDSKNLIKRVERDIAKMSADNFIARKYREWQDFLNNIDT